MRSRKRERSVRVPSRPPTLLEGEVVDRHGTPAIRSGREARARREVSAASLSAVRRSGRASWEVESGVEVSSEGV